MSSGKNINYSYVLFDEFVFYSRLIHNVIRSTLAIIKSELSRASALVPLGDFGPSNSPSAELADAAALATATSSGAPEASSGIPSEIPSEISSEVLGPWAPLFAEADFFATWRTFVVVEVSAADAGQQACACCFHPRPCPFTRIPIIDQA